MPEGSSQGARAQLPPPRDERPTTINDVLQSDAMKKRMALVLPRHLSPERMLRVMAMAVHKVPKLAECDMVTLLGAMMACASFGLEPNTPLGHAYLIPFEKKKKIGGKWQTEKVDVNLIVGYRGFIDLARRSGTLVSIHADVVYGSGGKDLPPDEFSFEYGSNMHLRHRPIGDNEGRPPVWAYAHAQLTDGQAFEVLPWARIERIRDKSEGYRAAVSAKVEAENDPQHKGWRMRAYESSPWVAFQHEMGAKTMIRRLSKMLPLSIEFANAAQLDAMSEAGKVDFSTLSEGFDAQTIDIEQAAARRDDEGSQDPAEQRQIEQSRETAINVVTTAEPEKAAATVERTEPKAQAQPVQQQEPQGAAPATAQQEQPAAATTSAEPQAQEAAAPQETKGDLLGGQPAATTTATKPKPRFGARR